MIYSLLVTIGWFIGLGVDAHMEMVSEDVDHPERLRLEVVELIISFVGFLLWVIFKIVNFVKEKRHKI